MREYRKDWSDALGREMELLRFGEGGLPLLVFPTSQGRFYQWEDFGRPLGAQKYQLVWRRRDGQSLRCWVSSCHPSGSPQSRNSRSSPSTRAAWMSLVTFSPRAVPVTEMVSVSGTTVERPSEA